ncbi:MAG: hypothetical protein AAF152_04350 [Cyanobacteria bacterium P01_A01_bin.114]
MRHRVVALSTLTTLLLAVTACGESRSAQCGKIGDILNATSSQMLSFSSTSEGFVKGAELADQAAADLEALKLGDKKLSNLRSHLAAAYRATSTTSREMETISGGEGSVVVNADSAAVVSRFEETSKEFQSVFNATQSYCSGGSVPSELTSKPAS